MKYRALIRAAGKKLWRELGEEALKAAVNTLVEEGVEAAVEIWKKRRLRIQDEILDQRDFAEDEGESADGEAEEETVEASDVDPGEPRSYEGDEDALSGFERFSIEGLGAYANRKSSES